jgi:hypothetical protein
MRDYSDSANSMTRASCLADPIDGTVDAIQLPSDDTVRGVPANLILVMHLLRDTSPHITMDAFHVF